MEKDNLLQKDIPYYRNKALTMMDIYRREGNIQFVQWLNKFEYVAGKMKVPFDKMKEFFLTMIDNTTHEYLRNEIEGYEEYLQFPYELLWHAYLRRLDEGDFDLHKFRLEHRKQYEDETIEEYADSLEKMFNKCDDKSNKCKILKEHFCKGIIDDNIRSNLENNSLLLFEEIIEVAIELEKLYNVNRLVETALSVMIILKKSEIGNFHTWINDFEYVADKLKVPENKMIEFFNKMIDNRVHMQVKFDLASINLPQPVNYEDVRKKYCNKIYHTNDKIFNRDRLKYRKQYKDEPMMKYANSLKKIYDQCNFQSDDLLYKYFYSGMRFNGIGNQLRLSPDKSFTMIAAEASVLERTKILSQCLKVASGKMDSFKIGTGGNFLVWLNKFEYVAEMIDVPDDLMVEFFENMVNIGTHQIVKKECFIENLSNHSYEEIVYYYTRQFSKDKEDLFIERYEYRNQYEKETIEKYAINLRKLFSKCSYRNRLNENLTIRFINGIRDDEIKIYLKTFSNLTFRGAIKKALNPIKNILRDYLRQALLMINTCESESKDDFFTWLNRFEYVINKMKVPDDIMIDFFNNMMDTEVHMRVKNNDDSVDFSQLSYQKIIINYLNYFSDKNEKNYYRSRFINRTQFEDETIEEYANNLKKIYEKCTYKGSHDGKLRQQFINGIFNDGLKINLTEYSSLSMDELLKKALELEKSNKVTHYLNKALTMIQIFDPVTEGAFYEWLNKFEFVTDLIKVPDELMVEIFEKMIDSDIRTIVQGTYRSIKFSEKPFDSVADYYLLFYTPPNENLNEIRFKFRQRYEKETITNYANRLQKIYDKCSFRKSYERKLHEQFLSGIGNDETKNVLTPFKNFPFGDIVEIAIELENNKNMPSYERLALTHIRIYTTKNEGLFIKWLNYFESYADYLEFPDELMVDIFEKQLDKYIHMYAKKTFSILNFSKLSYEEVINCYLRYFSPYEVDLHINRFKYRHKFKHETIEMYANNLRKILGKCSYANRHDTNLNRYFINNIVGDGIKNYFQKFLNLTIEEVLEKAIAILKNDELNPYLNKAFPMIHTCESETKDDFFTWLNRFEFVVDKIKVPDNIMIDFFNNMIDIEVHVRVKNKYHSVDFSQLPYQEIITNYINYFSNENENNFYRSRLINRTQFEDETIEEYANNLKTIYSICNYEGIQENTLLQLFVNGILNDGLKKYVTENSSLPIDELLAKTIKFDKSRRIIPYLNKAQRIMNIFKTETEDIFYRWLNKFEEVVDILEVPNDLILDFYNAMIDKETLTRINSTIQNVNNSALSYDETVNNHLSSFHQSESNIHLKRFYDRKQFENEKVAKYANHLKQINNKCNPKIVDDKIFNQHFRNGLRDFHLQSLLNFAVQKPTDIIIEEAIRFENNYQINVYKTEAFIDINKFNQESYDKFYEWLNCFEYVADKIGVTDNNMARFFNHMINNNVKEIINKTYPDIEYKIIPYELIINKYLDYFYIVDNNNTQRDRFINRMQYGEEIIEKYANNLRKIFHMCNYRSGHDRRLIEQFVHGIRNNELKNYLRDNPSLSYNETVKNAIDFETRNYIKNYQNSSLITIYNTENEEEFCIWLNKFEFVADLLDVPDFPMIQLFNEMVDNNVHTMVKDADSYINLSELSYDEIVDHYLRHFYPNEVDVRLKCFRGRNQYKIETIQQFSKNLRKIFNKCSLSSRQNENISMKFVNGLLDEILKTYLNRLLPDLSFNEIVQMAIEQECIAP